MPTKIVNDLIEQVDSIKKAFDKHLEESIKIKVQLGVNTVLTGLILTAVIGKFLVEYFKR